MTENEHNNSVGIANIMQLPQNIEILEAKCQLLRACVFPQQMDLNSFASNDHETQNSK
jgi:hypothetical protein